MFAHTVLVLGLLLFLGPHSLRIFADDWRHRRVAALGEKRWKGIYAAVAAVGLVLVVWGYGLTRDVPVAIWSAPVWTRHLAAVLTLPAFVLLVAAYLPGSHIKTALRHPMLAGTALWAFAHLLANGTLADLLLFGGFLAWSATDFVSARRREPASGITRPALKVDATAVLLGIVAWAIFARFLHGPLIGVPPFV